MKKAFKGLLVYIIIFVAVILVVMAIKSFMPKPELLYSELITEINKNNVESIILDDETATVTLREEITVERETPDGKKEIKTLTPDKKYSVDVMSVTEFQAYMTEVLNNAQPVLDENGKETGEVSPSFRFDEDMEHIPAWLTYIPYVIFIGIMLLFIFIFLGQSNGNGKVMNFSKSRARLYTTSGVKFEDIAGAEEEKEEMAEIVDFLKDPKKFTDLGARIPKGVILVGPPGTGKTYLAKAVAGEAGVPFFSISGSDFVEMYVGVGAARVRDMFEQAKKAAPAIIFIDEIDAVGRHRGAGLGGGHDEREQTLNQLLVEMDGFGTNEGIIIIAATNRPDILDPALTRPGRFDRKITVGYPDVKAREKILAIHSRKKPLADNVNLEDIAKNTAGFTAADLENLMNESALIAARKGSDKIKPEYVKEATFKVIVGPEKRSHVMSENDKKITAYHEAGHAIAVKLISSTDKVDRVSIIPAGSAGGYTAHRPDKDEDYITKTQLFEHIVVALGGKAAEEIVFGDVSTGASSDLQSANGIAMDMVAKYGMSETLGNVIVNTGNDEVFLGKTYGHSRSVSEELSSLVDREVKKIIDSAYDKAKQLLTENRDKLDAVSMALIEKERLEAEDFDAIMTGAPIADTPAEEVPAEEAISEEPVEE